MSESRPRIACWTKGTDREAGPPRYSHHWVGARRARLVVYGDRLVCGDWVIPIGEIRAATLFEARQLLLIPVFILCVQTDERTYQFGLNPWCKIAPALPFAFERERVRLGYSPFSLAIRLLLLAYLAYLLWHRLG